MSEFLGALVVLLRPTRVVETGTHLGYTAEMIARALGDYGFLDTIEKDSESAAKARQRLEGLPAQVHNTESLNFHPSEPVDLLFLDSELDIRKQELEHFKSYASNRCVWVMHDTRYIDVEGLFLPTPRGISMGRL